MEEKQVQLKDNQPTQNLNSQIASSCSYPFLSQPFKVSMDDLKNSKESIIKSLKSNGFVILQNIQNIKKITDKLMSCMKSLEWSDCQNEICGVGVQQVKGVVTSYRNVFMNNSTEIISKRLANVETSDGPELLDSNSTGILDASLEQEALGIAQIVFKSALECISNEQEEKEKLEKKNKNFNNILSVFERSEVAKIKSACLNEPTREDCQLSSPDFGLGSVIFSPAKITFLHNPEEVSQELKDASKLLDDSSCVPHSTLELQEGEVAITCGSILQEILQFSNDISIVLPDYRITLTQSSPFLHQIFFYPYLSFNIKDSSSIPPSIGQNQQLNESTSNKQNQNSSKLSSSLMTQALSMYTGFQNIKSKLSPWLASHSDKIKAFQLLEYSEQVNFDFTDPITVTELPQSLAAELTVSKAINSKGIKPNNLLRSFVFNWVDTTMNVAAWWRRKYILENQPLAFIARRQSKGKGQRDNTWSSPLGNCYVTFLFKSQSEFKYCLPQIACLSVIETLDQILQSHNRSDIKPQTKWVNDVFIGDSKISGALVILDNQDNITMGIGVNLNVKPSNQPNATCLKDLLKLNQDIDVDTFILKLWKRIQKNIAQLEEWGCTDGFFGKLEQRMMFIKQQVIIYDLTLTKVLHKGIFIRLNEYGNAILIETIDGKSEEITVCDGRMRLDPGNSSTA